MLLFALLALTLAGCLAGLARWAWLATAAALATLGWGGYWSAGLSVVPGLLPFAVGVGNAATQGLLQVLLVVYVAVHLYSVHYLGGQRGQRRYFSFLSLFLLGMATLMAAESHLALLLGWETIGLASFGLVSFYRAEQPVAQQASWVFWLNRGGDAALLAAVGLALAGHPWAIYGYLGAAVVKSALFPFSVWLPWAMVGPTPVSALLHAATLVVAGVVLLTHPLVQPLWAEAPALQTILQAWGLLSAVLAAWAACQTLNLKRLLAYSTLAHIGLMMMATPAGTDALGHLGTHAIFKTGLFLSLGLLHRYEVPAWQAWPRVWQLLRRQPTALLAVVAAGLFAWALLGLAPWPAHATKAALFHTLLLGPAWAPTLAYAAYTALTAVYAVRFVAGFAQALAHEVEAHGAPGWVQLTIVAALVPLLAWDPLAMSYANLGAEAKPSVWMEIAPWVLLAAALGWQAARRGSIALPAGQALFAGAELAWRKALGLNRSIALGLQTLDAAWALLWVRAAQGGVVLGWLVTSAEAAVLACVRLLGKVLLLPFRWLVDDAGTLSPARMAWTALAVALVAGWWFG